MFSKAVGAGHRAIECEICNTWIHLKCNKFDKTDYKSYQDNPDQTFFCIKCCADNIAFSTLNDNQFEICVNKGIIFLLDDVTGFKSSASEQQLLTS